MCYNHVSRYEFSIIVQREFVQSMIISEADSLDVQMKIGRYTLTSQFSLIYFRRDLQIAPRAIHSIVPQTQMTKPQLFRSVGSMISL